MRSVTSNSLEEEVEIDPGRAVEVYVQYRDEATSGRRRLSSFRRREPPTPAHRLDDDIHWIARTLPIRTIDPPGAFYLASKSTFYNWEAGKVPASPPTVRRGVVAAVYRLTGIDISLDSALTRAPLSLSQLALLNPVTLKRTSNQPDGSGSETYELTLPYVRLWADEFAIKSSWWRKPVPTGESSESTAPMSGQAATLERPDTTDVLGTIRFSVPQANLNIANLEPRATSPLVRLRPEDDDKAGKIDGGVLVWNGDNSWELAVLQEEIKPVAVLTEAVLGKIKAKPGTAVTFQVQAQERHIQSEFRLAPGPALAAGRRIDTIEKLMSIVLAGRRDGMGTLAVHVVDAK